MKNIKAVMVFLVITAMLVLSGCSASNNNTASKETDNKENGVINLYTDRHYDTDQALFDLFTKETGIKVNVVKAESDELIERLAREGKDTKADLLITADAGRLYRAKEKELLQTTSSETLFKNVPENLRDKDNQWFGLTKRARVIVYAKDRVDPAQLSTYEDLTDAKWKGKVLVRSANNIYNQSLLASFIALNGEDQAKAWAKDLVANMAREPKGNDRDQAKAVVAGEGDVAIMNTYYVGKMLHSSDPEEVKVANKVAVFFPNQNTTGTHINVSGVGLTKYAKNKDNAIKLMEFLSSEKAQKQFAEANFEYPVNPNVEPSELLKSWGDFKAQDINLSLLGENNQKAVRIFNEVGWK
ncbi:extracellular solute-binding protein, family 1 [Desulforamulus reducens MI-1]|uniref:Extracellular solute-binding protein, family 1 n=1 Tax=Desulforamulus reducens (strain ATCC BAA-1160 / DSM 100696 / MI-1) TaxID=349161 RepID=A4J4Q5_DESRM|nr:Fe(3+) ABC transporter substrate-binding protein [Desulforamulus reducens]ABO50058.1 extracellular solute-binding protein, family 1 [Desulforamulus reducens MI-1]